MLPKDHFIRENGVEFAGRHVIADYFEAKHLDDEQRIHDALVAAVAAAKATLLHVHVHRFSEGGGISGVAVLAESHISVHTWPERSYAAFDIFMCGEAMPLEAEIVLRNTFKSERHRIAVFNRGLDVAN